MAFLLDGRAILLCRVGGALYALRDECPHARVPLADGALRGTVLECPLHGGKLDVRDGRPVSPPIRRPAMIHPVREHGGVIEIGLGPEHPAG